MNLGIRSPLRYYTFGLSAVLDNFNRADTGPPPSANWTTVVATGIAVVSNQLAGAPSGSAYWNLATFGPNCEVYITQPVVATGASFSIIARWSGPGSNGYGIRINRPSAGVSSAEMVRIDGGFFTVLGAAVNVANVAGDSFGLSVVGSTLTAYRKAAAGGGWAPLFSRTDATYTDAGYLSVRIQDADVRLDDFGGGSV